MACLQGPPQLDVLLLHPLWVPPQVLPLAVVLL
jgi:hypothetical protein